MMSLSMDEEKKGLQLYTRAIGLGIGTNNFMGSAACRTKLATVWQDVINGQVKGAEQKKDKTVVRSPGSLAEDRCWLLLHSLDAFLHHHIAGIVVPYDHAMQHNVPWVCVSVEPSTIVMLSTNG